MVCLDSVGLDPRIDANTAADTGVCHQHEELPFAAPDLEHTLA